MNDVLLTVSGKIEADIEARIARGERPLADYIAMARGFPADLIDYPAARRVGRGIGRLLEKIGGPNLMLAWACFRQRGRYRVIFTDGEQVGIPLAFLLKFGGGRERPRHLMIAHRISVLKKTAILDVFGLHSHIDRWFAYSSRQQAFIQNRWKLPAGRVCLTPFMVDARFFNPARLDGPARWVEAEAKGRPVICAIGRELRDYPTLIEAVRGLDLHLFITAGSPWSKRGDTTAGVRLPENVTVRRFTLFELRELYAASRFVSMPLYPVDFQAGVTAILEAMAMGRAVICTRAPGQTDVVVEGETGLYVEPGDPSAMRAAIQWLLDHPEEAERMGRNGRKRIETEMNLDLYVSRLARYVHSDAG